MTQATATGYAASAIDELPTALDGSVKLLRSGLGISSFGVQVWDLPPNQERIQDHDETASGQEELYVALQGAGAVLIDRERYPLDPDHVVRVGPEVRRALSTGPQGLRLLCIGGSPGRAYEAPEWSEPQ